MHIFCKVLVLLIGGHVFFGVYSLRTEHEINSRRISSLPLRGDFIHQSQVLDHDFLNLRINETYTRFESTLTSLQLQGTRIRNLVTNIAELSATANDEAYANDEVDIFILLLNF
jgi:hypothetical protein